MIPILYEAFETEFKSNGVGRLIDAVECKVSEEINAEYELSMSYPISGAHYRDIKLGAYIYTKPYQGAQPQAFSIYKISRPLGGIVEINAEHISYRLSYIPVFPYTAATANLALSGLKTNAIEKCPFVFSTDISDSKTFTCSKPTSARKLLGKDEESILSTYGGELEFDIYNVKLLKARGEQTGRVLRYGKDIVDLKQEENIENMITGICPFYEKDGRIVTLAEKVIHASIAQPFAYQRTQVLDISSEFDHTPSETEIRNYTVNYIEENNVGIPSVSIDINFIDLAETEEYKYLINFENLKIGDIISVQFEKLGVDATAKIVSYEYDVLRERYISLTVGDVKPSLAKAIISGQKVNTSSIVNAAVSEMNRYKRAGSKQVNLNNTFEAALLSMTELDSLFGLPSGTCTNLNTVITATNADNVNNIPVVGVTYNAGAWHIKFESAVNASILIAYTANYYGEG